MKANELAETNAVVSMLAFQQRLVKVFIGYRHTCSSLNNNHT